MLNLFLLLKLGTNVNNTLIKVQNLEQQLNLEPIASIELNENDLDFIKENYDL